MRRLRRSGIVPNTLRATGSGGRRAALNEDEWRKGNEDGINVDTGYWGNDDVRGALHAMQGFACAYCQRKLDYYRGFVDHFRPRNGPKEPPHDGYWWLAYRFTNCFLACGPCNGGSGKGSQFPLAVPTTRAKPCDDPSLETETRLYLDPVADKVDEWLAVEWRSGAREGFIEQRKNIAVDSLIAQRIERSILDFRLNIDQKDLRKKRIRAIRDADNAQQKQDRAETHRLACRYLPHGAAVYQFIREVKPEFLPSAREELLIFLAKLKELVTDALNGLHIDPQDSAHQRDLEALRWTLAWLWKEPPPDSLTPDEIRAWLETHLPLEMSDIAKKRDAP